MTWVVEEGLTPHQAKQKLRLLVEAGCDAFLESRGSRIGILLRGQQGLQEELDLLLHCHRLVMEEAARQGIRVEPYKPLDRAELVAALRRGNPAQAQDWKGAAHLWHELVWSQGLPNTNHRTALLFLERVLNPPGAAQRMDFAAAPEWGEALLRASKPLILAKEFAPDQERAKQDHLRVCLEHFQRFSPEDAQ